MEKLDSLTEIESFLYMSYWYGGLYVVIEGWQRLKLSDDIIDNLLISSNVQLLKRYRNGVFHFQKEYIDKSRAPSLSVSTSSQHPRSRPAKQCVSQ